MEGVAEAPIKQLMAVWEVSRTIASHITIPDLLRNLASTLSPVVDSDFLALMLYDAPRKILRVHSLEKMYDGAAALPPGTELPAERLWVEWLRKKQHLGITSDGHQETHFTEAMQIAQAHGVRSLHMLPLSIANRFIGVLCVGRGQLRPYVSADLELLSTLSEPVALAVDNILRDEQVWREQKSAEVSLQASDGRWKRVFENSAVGVALTDLEGRFETANAAYQKLLGYTQEELRKLSFLDLTIQDFQVKNWALVTELLEQKRQQFNIEKQYRRKDGSLIWVRNNVSLVPDPDGAPHYIMAIVEDISERKCAEEKLRQSEWSLREALTNVKRSEDERTRISAARADISMALARKDNLSGILRACAEALVQHLDAAFARIWTLSSDGQELVLQASAGIYTRLDGCYSRVPLGELKIGLIAQERKAHLTNDVENDPRIRDKEWARSEKITAFAGYPLVVEDKVVGAMGMFSRNPLAQSTLDTLAFVAGSIAQGIERKRAEEALRESEEETRLIVDTTPDAAVTMDANGFARRWNAAAERIFGWPASEAINRPVAELIMPLQYREAYQDGLQKFFATGEGSFLGKAIEVTAMRRDGEEFPVELSVAPAKLGGAWVFNAFVRDVTERKRAEAALQEAQAELAHVTRVLTMGEFTASIAHEVNQPLSAIVANGGACLRWLNSEPADLEEARESVKKIIRDANRAGEVIKGVRGLAKKSALQLKPLNMNELIAGVIALVRGEIQRNRAALTTELAPNLASVLGDRVQLEQVLLNLILNGMEAMLEVAPGQRCLVVGSRMGESGGVLVYVRDCGAGMSAEVMQNIFKPFFTTKPGGTGVGLSISKSIVEAHHGRLWATPNEERGTTFCFLIPAAKQ